MRWMKKICQKSLNKLNIVDGFFTLEEYQLAKKSLKGRNQAGPDNVTPQVLKRCDLDDIILSFDDKLLSENTKPD